jgi:hypothetical protein
MLLALASVGCLALIFHLWRKSKRESRGDAGSGDVGDFSAGHGVSHDGSFSDSGGGGDGGGSSE